MNITQTAGQQMHGYLTGIMNWLGTFRRGESWLQLIQDFAHGKNESDISDRLNDYSGNYPLRPFAPQLRDLVETFGETEHDPESIRRKFAATWPCVTGFERDFDRGDYPHIEAFVSVKPLLLIWRHSPMDSEHGPFKPPTVFPFSNIGKNIHGNVRVNYDLGILAQQREFPAQKVLVGGVVIADRYTNDKTGASLSLLLALRTDLARLVVPEMLPSHLQGAVEFMGAKYVQS